MSTLALRRLARSEHGAMALLTVFMAIFLVACLFYVVGIGDAILQRERLQDAADAAAFSAATLHARGMNLIALANIVMAALLAVLVALKLIEMLATLGLALCVVLSFWVPGAAALIPKLEILRKEVRAAHDAVKPAVMTGIRILHTAQRATRASFPATATVASTTLVADYYAPAAELGFAVPPRVTLPVDNDSYDVLCAKAGDYVGDLVALPFTAIIDIDLIADLISDGVEDLVTAEPKWFCDAQRGAPPKLNSKFDQGLPLMPSAEACAKSDPSSPEAAELCLQADLDRERSEPDPTSGACTGACDEALFTDRTTRARKECNPNEVSKLKKFRYVVREVEYRAEPLPTGELRWQATELSVTTAESKTPPCPIKNLDGDYEWSNATEYDDGTPRPVCRMEVFSSDTVKVYSEVTQILGCKRPTKLEQPVEDLSKDPELATGSDDDSRSPQKMLDGASLGGEDFQLRAFVVAASGKSREPLVALAAWGRDDESLDYSVMKALGRVHFAQAEYYFDHDGSVDPSAFLWRMSWKARLRRVRLPSSSASAPSSDSVEPELGVEAPALDVGAACERVSGLGEQLGSSSVDGSLCQSLDKNLSAFERLIVH